MATEFVTTPAGTTDWDGPLALVRWWGGDARGVLVELGTVSNFERVCAALRAGEELLPLGSRLAGDPRTAQDLEQMAADGRATFGEMAFTVAVGSGDLFNLTVETTDDLFATES